MSVLKYMKMTELQLNDYGRFRFTISNKKHKIAMGFNLVGCITDVDKYRVEITDNDGLLYMPKKSDVTLFEPMEKPETL